MCELLKNSFRATLLTSEVDINSRPVRIRVCRDVHHVAIKVSDEAGGIPFEVGDQIWSYMYGTAAKIGNMKQLSIKKDSDLENPQNLTGYGVGLPCARLYARYLGGKLSLTSYPGYGTQAHLILPRLESQEPQWPWMTSIPSGSINRHWHRQDGIKILMLQLMPSELSWRWTACCVISSNLQHRCTYCTQCSLSGPQKHCSCVGSSAKRSGWKKREAAIFANHVLHCFADHLTMRGECSPQVAELLVHFMAQTGSTRDLDSKTLFDKHLIILSKNIQSLMMRLVHACSTFWEACPRSEIREKFFKLTLARNIDSRLILTACLESNFFPTIDVDY